MGVTTRVLVTGCDRTTGGRIPLPPTMPRLGRGNPTDAARIAVAGGTS
jgi:hypothetical protein